ncbi:MAG TPA: hypothetical protein VK524_10185 [Polyangiaceae bacterium]|nr:hypothetical protein [Polyangiaceae bacterium]
MTPFWGTKQAMPGPLGVWNYREILISTLGGGEWPEFERRLSLGLLAEAHTNECGEGIDDEAVRRAAESYRRAEGLLTVEETEQWLAAQDLSHDDWEQYLVRGLLRARVGVRLTLPAHDLSRHAAFGEAFFGEAVFSDFLPDARARFAKLLALVAEGDPPPLPDSRELARDIALRYPWLGEVSEPSVARVHAVLARAQERIDTGTSAPRMAALIAERELEWTRLECYVVTLPSERIGRELVWCTRSERRPLVPELTRRAGVLARRQAFLLEDAPTPAKGALASAQPGSVVGPVRDGTTWKLYQLVSRRLPALTDADVVRMARINLEQQLLNEAWVRSRRREAAHG